jgi:L-histidine Nalpha-methyltransferase
MTYNDQNIIVDQFSIKRLLEKQSNNEIISEIFAGLTANLKYISSRFFYDEKGSSLFESITRLEEYYPSRTEKTILKQISSNLLNTIGSTEIVELGSGDYSKISILLKSLTSEILPSVKYYPVDISETSIINSAEVLTGNFPEIQINGILADFMKHMEILPGKSNRLICFFGSTIGNLTHDEAITFLAGMRKIMRLGDTLLVGYDMVKEIDILESAYNDDQRITEAFNRNILSAINGIAETSFEPEQFKHLAFYNQEEMRIEMHLEALKDMRISCPNFPYFVHIREGETIHTENSHKFTKGLICDMADKSGLQIQNIFSDNKEWFSLVQYHCNG